MTPREIATAFVLGAVAWLPVLAWLSLTATVVVGLIACLGALVVGCWAVLEDTL